MSHNWSRIGLVVAAISAATFVPAPAIAQIVSPGAPTISPPILDNSNPSSAPLLVVPGASIPNTRAPATPSPTQPPEPPAVQAPAQAAAPASPAPAAQGAAPVSTAGTVVKAYGDWSTQCLEKAVDGMKCQMLQKVVSKDQTLLVMALAFDPGDKRTRIQIALPLGVAIGSGTQIAVGDKYQGNIAIDRCTQQGCIVEGEMTDDLIAAFKRQEKATVIVFNDAKTQIPLPFSLNGFTAAYEAMIDANR